MGLATFRLTATELPCSMESAARSAALAAEQVAARHGRRLVVAQPAPETVGAVGWLRRHLGASKPAGAQAKVGTATAGRDRS